MSNTLLGRSVLLFFGVALLASAGCGPGKGTPVSGKVVLPGKMTFEKDDSVEIVFIPEDAKKRGATVFATASGKSSDVSFTNLNTAETTGVLPGKYKVTVKVTPYAGAPGSNERKRAFDDAINKQYDAIVSKLTYEVAAGSEPQTITIDLGKGTVTKN